MEMSGVTLLENLEARKKDLETDLAYLAMKIETLPCSQRDEEKYNMLLNELESTQFEIDLLLWETLRSAGA